MKHIVESGMSIYMEGLGANEVEQYMFVFPSCYTLTAVVVVNTRIHARAHVHMRSNMEMVVLDIDVRIIQAPGSVME